MVATMKSNRIEKVIKTSTDNTSSNYWRRGPWGWRRWGRWRGFGLIIFAISMIAWLVYVNTPDPDTANTYMIIFIVIIVIVAIAQFILMFYYLRKRDTAGRTQVVRRQRRRDLASDGHQTKYCISCGRTIADRAAYCEFCGAEQDS